MQWYRRRVHGDIAWDPATSTTTTMNTFLFFSSLIAYVSAGTVAVAPVAGVVVGNAAPYLVRAPAHDSASIEHHRLGGNFAYSTAEAHAFAEVIPQISTLTHPVAETTHTHIPSPIGTFQPAPIIQTHHVAQPIFKNVPTYGTQHITGPVRTHQTVHQPIVHETSCSCCLCRCPCCSCCLCCCPCCSCWICWIRWSPSCRWICWICWSRSCWSRSCRTRICRLNGDCSD